ncbi:Uncharacterised protein [Salmonella enterica subsp. enterica serovar Bovismorbificans]|uniref:Uncharacterized protein n=1 Tax=Salmonella enterica subsp. enterica serovar Bovismorbificans TaxID=58097 RepID=A0A655EHI9_SALET|nr:Uncharacterised protein [Salmonella enterica subsp. enterica serovar Bovismorbificans]
MIDIVNLRIRIPSNLLFPARGIKSEVFPPINTAVAKKLLNTGIPGLCCIFFQQCGNIKTIPRRVRFTVHSEIMRF